MYSYLIFITGDLIYFKLSDIGILLEFARDTNATVEKADARNRIRTKIVVCQRQKV